MSLICPVPAFMVYLKGFALTYMKIVNLLEDCDQGWGESSVGKVLTLQTQGHEFNSQNSYIK